MVGPHILLDGCTKHSKDGLIEKLLIWNKSLGCCGLIFYNFLGFFARDFEFYKVFIWVRQQIASKVKKLT